MRKRLLLTSLTMVLGALAVAGVAAAKTSHAGWPKINGILKMHKADETSDIHGTARNDELLGGHRGESIWGGAGKDVLWGDYKPGGQPTDQVDHLYGGAGDDFIYASHGRNIIDAGSGKDTIHAHFGYGSIDCGSGHDTLFISHKSRPKYKLSHCERISYKTLGY